MEKFFQHSYLSLISRNVGNVFSTFGDGVDVNGEDVYRSHNSRSNRLAAAWECIGKICLTAAATGVGRRRGEDPRASDDSS